MELIGDKLPGAVERGAVGVGALLAETGDVINGALGVSGGFLAFRRQGEAHGVQKFGVVEEEFRFAVAAFVAGLAGVEIPR